MMQTSFRCFRSLPFFIFPKFTSLNFHLVVKHVHCFYVVFLSFGVDIIPYGVVFWVKKALFVSPRWSPPISAKISTSYTCRPGWLSGEQGDSDWAKRHLLNAKLMDRAMKAEGSEWMERLIFMLTCWDGWRLQKAQHVLHFWAKNGSQKNSFDVFFFFGGQKNESGCLPPCCWYSPTIHFSSFWSETSVGCILLQSHFFTSRILKYWDSCHSKGGFFFWINMNSPCRWNSSWACTLASALVRDLKKWPWESLTQWPWGAFRAALRDPKNDVSFFSGCRFDHNKSSKPLGSAIFAAETWYQRWELQLEATKGIDPINWKLETQRWSKFTPKRCQLFAVLEIANRELICTHRKAWWNPLKIDVGLYILYMFKALKWWNSIGGCVILRICTSRNTSVAT